MSDLSAIDPFVCTEPGVNEDEETLAAIDAGIRAADEGRFISSDEMRERVHQWISKSSIPNPR